MRDAYLVLTYEVREAGNKRTKIVPSIAINAQAWLIGAYLLIKSEIFFSSNYLFIIVNMLYGKNFLKVSI